MRINYAIILASVTGIMGQMYNQGFSDSCACLQTRTCVVDSPCLQKEKLRKVKKPKTKRSCGACKGQGPCNACQAPIQKQYEAVPVFMGQPEVYQVVGSKQVSPTSSGYGPVSQNQFVQPSVMEYNYQQPQQYSYPQQQYSTVSSQYVQAPLPQQYVQAPYTQQYGQAPCATCGPSAPVQNQRVYVPLKPSFWQRRTMRKSIKAQAARQPCSGPSCPGCATCGGNSGVSYSQAVPQYYQVPQVTSYQVPQVTSYQVPQVTSYQVPQVTSYQVPQVTSYQVPQVTSYQVPQTTTYQVPQQATYIETVQQPMVTQVAPIAQAPVIAQPETAAAALPVSPITATTVADSNNFTLANAASAANAAI